MSCASDKFSPVHWTDSFQNGNLWTFFDSWRWVVSSTNKEVIMFLPLLLENSFECVFYLHLVHVKQFIFKWSILENGVYYLTCDLSHQTQIFSPCQTCDIVLCFAHPTVEFISGGEIKIILIILLLLLFISIKHVLCKKNYGYIQILFTHMYSLTVFFLQLCTDAGLHSAYPLKLKYTQIDLMITVNIIAVIPMIWNLSVSAEL